MPISTLSVFVYGTLQPRGYYWSQFCEGKVSEVIPAQIKGKLFDLGLGYPGARFDRNGWVKGYLLEFKHKKDFLRVDYLEGFEPDRLPELNEYNRLIVPIFDLDENLLGSAWAYEITPKYLEASEVAPVEAGMWPA